MSVLSPVTSARFQHALIKPPYLYPYHLLCHKLHRTPLLCRLPLLASIWSIRIFPFQRIRFRHLYRKVLLRHMNPLRDLYSWRLSTSLPLHIVKLLLSRIQRVVTLIRQNLNPSQLFLRSRNSSATTTRRSRRLPLPVKLRKVSPQPPPDLAPQRLSANVCYHWISMIKSSTILR